VYRSPALRDEHRSFATKYELVVPSLVTAIGFALVAVGMALTALLSAERRRHGPTQ